MHCLSTPIRSLTSIVLSIGNEHRRSISDRYFRHHHSRAQYKITKDTLKDTYHIGMMDSGTRNSVSEGFMNLVNFFSALSMTKGETGDNMTKMEERNAQNDDVAATLSQWNNELAYSLIWLDVFLCLYILLGVSGNILIIIIYQFKIKKKFEDRFFIMMLAVLDICVCVTGPATYLLLNIVPVDFYNNWGCKLAWYNGRTLSNTSGMLILVIAIQRYLKVCRPFGWQMTIRWQKTAVVALFIISLLMDVPILFFYGTSFIHNPLLGVTGSRCGRRINISPDFELGISIYFYCMFATALFVISGIAFMYVLIGRKIMKQMKKKRAMSEGPSYGQQTDMETETSVAETQTRASEYVGSDTANLDSVQKRKKKKKDKWAAHRYSLMFMTISAVCGVTYAPSLIVNMSVNLDSDEFWIYYSPIQRQVCLFVFQVFLLNHVSNPFIYGFFDSSFRSEMKRLFKLGRTTNR